MKSGKITYRVTAVPLSQYDIKYVYPNVEKKKKDQGKKPANAQKKQGN